MQNTIRGRLRRDRASCLLCLVGVLPLSASLDACTSAEPVTDNEMGITDGAAGSSPGDASGSSPGDASGSSHPDAPNGASCAACDGACEEAVAVGPATHVGGDIAYTDIPPAGGSHNDCWVDWGVHPSPVRPENWVHNLEHGGVIFLYACPDGCPDEIASLAAFVDGRQQALLTSYPEMPAGFAAVSWGYRLVSSCLDMAAMTRFYGDHVGNGLENVLSGAPAGCP